MKDIILVHNYLIFLIRSTHRTRYASAIQIHKQHAEGSRNFARSQINYFSGREGDFTVT